MARRTRKRKIFKKTKVERKANRKQKVKGFKKKVGTAAKKVISKAKEGGTIILLKPYAGLMKRVLKKKGVKAPSNLLDLAKTFFTNVVKVNHFDEHNHFGGNQSVVMDYENDYSNIDASLDNLDPVTITAIVSAVVKWIKGQMDKKKSNEPLTPVQEQAAIIGEKIETQYNEERENQVNMEVGDMLTQYWWVLALGAFLMIKK